MTNIKYQLMGARKLRFIITEFIMSILRKKPKFEVNDIVLVSFRLGNTPPVIVKCRVKEVFYWYHTLVYWVVSQEYKDGIWYGFKERVTEDKIAPFNSDWC